jgi:nucleoside-diphosphate-sugar epimerase
MQNILVTGGAGYLGSKLVPQLLKDGYKVKVYDLFIYGKEVLQDHINLEIIKGDIRDLSLLKNCLDNIDIVIHLACISNDPSFELNPLLGKTINLDPFEPMVKLSMKKGVKKFIYASSSSVYGIKKDRDVTEDMSLEPLTDYSKFKADCEKILLKYKSENFVTSIVRSATLCGYAPRQRLDVIVNIFANHGFHKRELNIFGGSQLRPNIHIDDIVRFYQLLLKSDDEIINGEIFNVGGKNYSVKEIAEITKNELGNDIKIIQTHSDDNRSYHISSKKVEDLLNFKVKLDVSDAIKDLKLAFEKKLLVNPLENEFYFNIKRMKKIYLN